jgi:hypothetical protein
MLNYIAIVDRIKRFNNFATNKEVARLFGISEPDFCRRKKKGTLLPLIVAWGVNHHVNMDWLLAGEDSKIPVGETEASVGEATPRYGALHTDLLKNVIQAVETGLSNSGRFLNPEEKAEVIALLYDFYLGAAKPIDEETVARYLRLVT